MSATRALALLIVASACGRSELFELDRSDAAVPPADAGPRADAGRSPDAGVLPAEPVLIAGAGGDVRDVELEDVEAIGDGFAVAWVENSGQLFVQLAILDARGVPRFRPARLSEEGQARSVALAWSGTELAVFWSDQRPANSARILMRRVSARGEPLGPARVLRNRTGNFALLASAVYVPGADTYRLIWTDDREQQFTYFPRYLAVDRDGVPFANEVRLVDRSGNLAYGRGLEGPSVHLVYVVRPDDFSDHRALLQRFDTFGTPVAEARELYVADTVHPRNSVSTEREIWLSLWDYQQGPRLLRDDDATTEVIALEGERSAQIALSRTIDGEIGALLETGSRRELATGLAFQTVPAGGPARPALTLRRIPIDSGACIESSLLVAGAGGFLALWQEGCTTSRAVYAMPLP